jgi:hypothetical protein
MTFMKKILNYLVKNLFSILCIAFVCYYLTENFSSYKERGLFLLAFIVLYGSPLLIVGFCRNFFLRKISFTQSLMNHRIKIILLLIAFGLIYFLSGWHFLGGLILGCLLFGIIIVVFFFFKYNRQL